VVGAGQVLETRWKTNYSEKDLKSAATDRRKADRQIARGINAVRFEGRRENLWKRILACAAPSSYGGRCTSSVLLDRRKFTLAEAEGASRVDQRKGDGRLTKERERNIRDGRAVSLVRATREGRSGSNRDCVAAWASTRFPGDCGPGRDQEQAGPDEITRCYRVTSRVGSEVQGLHACTCQHNYSAALLVALIPPAVVHARIDSDGSAWRPGAKPPTFRHMIRCVSYTWTRLATYGSPLFAAIGMLRQRAIRQQPCLCAHEAA